MTKKQEIMRDKRQCLSENEIVRLLVNKNRIEETKDYIRTFEHSNNRSIRIRCQRMAGRLYRKGMV